jgi:hypothetical protein
MDKVSLYNLGYWRLEGKLESTAAREIYCNPPAGTTVEQLLCDMKLNGYSLHVKIDGYAAELAFADDALFARGDWVRHIQSLNAAERKKQQQVRRWAKGRKSLSVDDFRRAFAALDKMDGMED